ncbi:putative nucleotidyltransferase substrate binding domain-containing protein [Corynebacterium halotolerans]|uniref:DUF294 domain-containing protein n=1 Tax=Corynebacterium halotolerans YIM 70093 = DSM 44683 TaxID=1121362 RepID=M1NKD6_9CORY|nr:putative nucleotidyltransferase substrate binding domain-containing protein [Corynebacterium halotolerans]AGF71873.1 hypothetical protein A605_04310 [Corynebacterium halotolerans YIM 70093 = DSM 44683]
MLHQSLLDLAAQAPLSGTGATARGVLAESHELLRNALDHREPETELVTWYSTLVADTLSCPAAVELSGGARVVPSGAVGRGDALPTSPVTWLTVTTGAPSGNPAEELAELVAGAGLPVGTTAPALAPAPAEVWRARADAAVADGDADLIAELADAGLLTAPGPVPALLEQAVGQRPASLRSHDGLPDRSMPVDVLSDILVPVSAVARWAGLAAGTADRSTPGRIAAGQEGGLLSAGEGDALQQAWGTGLALQFRRWVDRVDGHPAILGDLTALDRTAYGAAARMVAGVLRSLAARHDIPLAGL